MPVIHPTVRVMPDLESVCHTAAELVADGLVAAIEARGVAHWSTTGGSTAPGIYRALRVPPLRGAVDWSRVHAWFGDDRFVTPDNTFSNVRPCVDLLLVPKIGVPIPASQVHPIDVAGAIARGEGPAWAAAAYQAEILASGPGVGADGVPAFDVLVLGVGPDGHILSVFPGSPVWDEDALVVAVDAPEHVEPRVPRVTMHPSLVPAARKVVVLTSGSRRTELLARAWEGGDVRELPVRATLLPQATWVLDEVAAASLPRQAVEATVADPRNAS
jgi:6-phosphogluconolactonase